MSLIRNTACVFAMSIVLQGNLLVALSRSECQTVIAENMSQEMLTCSLCIERMNGYLDGLFVHSKEASEELIHTFNESLRKLHKKEHFKKTSPSRTEKKQLHQREIKTQLDDLIGYVSDSDDNEWQLDDIA